MSISVEPLTGPALEKALPALARLRITVFREWPYLYDGTLAYEERYLERFGKAENALIVAARDGEEIVGVSTGAAMVRYVDQFGELFKAHGLDVERMFYFGESVLLKAYRGRGFGHRFFDAREAHAKSLGGFTHTTFCGVIRPDDHPLRPKDYVPLDAFWTKRGYRKVAGLVGSFSWTDIGESGETAKPMQFWMRPL